ncbi:MAG TPA: DUF1236 domain-containing protein [Bradyrhizobium sp.]|jgi:hypothetical protein|nr:DUF1236 domain-containing protein [Bradyrhizobium sp.]
MTNRLMVSVAAIALIAGAGYANAQGAGAGHESGGGAMHNSAPAGGGSAAGGGAAAGGSAGGGAMEKRDSAAPTQGGSDMKQSQSDKPSGATKGQRADENIQGQKSKGMSSENETKGGAKDMKAEGREGQSGNMKAEGREGQNGNMKAEGREGQSGNMKAEGRGANERSQTTGMAGSGAKLTTEQRTKITSVIHNVHVAPVTNVNFSVSVGTRVPRDVEFHPLPAEVVTVYPEWRGYNFILVRDEIVVIDPNTYEIIAVINS